MVAGALAPAWADPTAEVGVALRDGALAPHDAAARWTESGADAATALEQLRSLPLAAGPEGDHDATLVDRFGRETPLLVRWPQDGPAADGRYRVLIALHGMNANPRQTVRFAPAVVPPHTILVAPEAQRMPAELEFEDMRGLDEGRLSVSSRMRHWWSYQPGSFPLLALDYLRARYPIDGDRVYLLGYSMGAFGTWNVGLRYHDRFAAIAPFSGGISRLEYLPFRDGRSRALLANARMLPALVVHGQADNVVPHAMSRRSVEALRERECDVEFVSLPGVRHWPFSKLHEERPGDVGRWLAARARDPHPARIDHTMLGSYHGGAYWIRVDGIDGERAHVEARVAAKDAITVTTQNVERVTVYLDPTLVDVTQPVTITVDGQQRFAGVVQPDVTHVAESYARTRDPALTYAHAVTIDLERQAPRSFK